MYKIYDEAYNITKNFKWTEIIVSDSYPELAANIVITDEQKTNIKELFKTVIQPIRNHLDESVKIDSCIRDEILNPSVGGSKTSDHLIGAAADITSESIRNNLRDTAHEIWNLELPIRQLIYYPENKFIHISINTDNKSDKNEFLYKKAKKYYKEL